MHETVAAIIENEGKVLLVKRADEPFVGKWVLPGGHIETGEDTDYAIVREVKEETGLSFYDFSFVMQNPEIFPEESWEAMVYVFKGKAKGELKKNSESSEIRFFSLDEIDALDIGFNHKKIIKEVLG